MRSQGLGGTDISAVVGLNPWRSPMDVYMEKVGLVEPQPDNEAMYWGRELEPAVLKRYAKETGMPVYPNNEVMVGNEDWILGTPDALVEPGGGVDAKTTGRPDSWGAAELGIDGVPEHVSCQAFWYMGITGARWWDIALLILSPRREFRIYRINRDQDVINSLVEAGRDFWFNHVLPQIPPPIDDSAGSSEYLKRTYPRDVGDIIAAPPEAETAIEMLQEARQIITTAEANKALAENRLKAMIGDAAGLLGQGWKCTWKKSKDRSVVDWEAAFKDLAANYYNIREDRQEEVDDVIKRFTTIKPSPRVFRIWEKKEG